MAVRGRHPALPDRRKIRQGVPGALAFAAVLTLALAQAEAGDKKTLGFAVVSWMTASYETADGKEECPQGFAVDNMELYLRTLTPEARDKFTGHGALDYIFDFKSRKISAERGPHGEDVCWNPTVVKDPPMRIVQGRKGYGLNLDGTKDGHATKNTCSHQKFVSLDGQGAVDNQWYRLVGCTYGWRSADGYMEKNPNGELHDSGHAILIAINGATDLRDDAVEVVFAEAAEPLVKDNAGGGDILAKTSYRIADGKRTVTRGRILNGVLTTDPVDARFPFYGNTIYAEHFIRGMRVRLELSGDGTSAKGLVAGYYDLDTWWDYLARVGYLAAFGHFSCPALYEAAHTLADGYPDPQTGACTALSAAFKISAVPAFVIDSAGEAYAGDLSHAAGP